jgi:hypothetical protein
MLHKQSDRQTPPASNDTLSSLKQLWNVLCYVYGGILPINSRAIQQTGIYSEGQGINWTYVLNFAKRLHSDIVDSKRCSYLGNDDNYAAGVLVV